MPSPEDDTEFAATIVAKPATEPVTPPAWRVEIFSEPVKHGGANYFLSVEVLKGTEVADFLSQHLRQEIEYTPLEPVAMKTAI
ncbi:hypothetical protein [Ochrobactrum sp. AN78]|uniref:hypothetical protein n=1 Tax=Ochrobactrum sp. AN78 TaxID=3039853 RepID=UPI002989FB06|nr:hypothetical protein [Ochrobactrum sp. AN78]MDH7791600.1 hypothetical protein [Ochrobactrum sp. AN78]